MFWSSRVKGGVFLVRGLSAVALSGKKSYEPRGDWVRLGRGLLERDQCFGLPFMVHYGLVFLKGGFGGRKGDSRLVNFMNMKALLLAYMRSIGPSLVTLPPSVSARFHSS